MEERRPDEVNKSNFINLIHELNRRAARVLTLIAELISSFCPSRVLTLCLN